MILFLLGIAGCGEVGQACTLMYAPNTLSIKVTEASDWNGEIEASVSGDARTISCTFVGGIGNCDDNESQISVDGSLLSLTLWDFAPEIAELIITVDGSEVVSENLQPDYEEDEPNGEGCGVRRFGTSVLSL